MLELLGRLHPLAVHLPIGFLVLLAALELAAVRPRFQRLSAARGFILGLTVPAAVFSAICGWVLARSGGYDETILGWHRWLGVGVASATVVLYLLLRGGAGRAYRVALAATVVWLAVVSHLGGSLTHGKDYLTAPVRKMLGSGSGEQRASAGGNLLQRPVYVSVIQPVFADYCITCHSGKKARAELRLDTAEHLERGGESGAVIVPGSAALSLLIKRLALPLLHDDHMPPEGKPQPAADEVALLRWWIDAGAPTDKAVAGMNPPEAILQTIRSRIDSPH